MKRLSTSNRTDRFIMGRPPKYEYRFAPMARKACKLGATDADLADLFEVTTYTIVNWRRHYPEFEKACRIAKGEFDDRVKRSLAQAAVGYTIDTEEVKVFAPDKDEAGTTVSEPLVHRYRVRKHYPPDVTACIFWLKNRLPKEFRDRIDIREEVDPYLGSVDYKSLLAQRLEAISQRMVDAGMLKIIDGKKTNGSGNGSGA